MVDDLSLRHEMISDLFPQPQTPDEWEQYRLSDDQVEFYRDNGYLAGIRVLDDRQIEALRNELALFFDPEHAGRELWYEYHTSESVDESKVLFHALGAWRIGSAFHDLLWAPAVRMAASQLLEGSVRFWHDQLFCKPALHGGVVAWHQDYSYWQRTRPMNHLSVWIGLDESTRENGCLHYVPGSHRWDLLPITGLAGDMTAIKEVLTQEQWNALNDPFAAEMEVGMCAFHHPLMIHGSFENRIERPRRATVVNLIRDGVMSDSDDPLLEGVPAIPRGEEIRGQFFPLLFDPSAL